MVKKVAQRLVNAAIDALYTFIEFLDRKDYSKAAIASLKAAEAYTELSKRLPQTSRAHRLAIYRATRLLEATRIIRQGKKIPTKLEYEIREFIKTPTRMQLEVDDPQAALQLKIRRIATSVYKRFLKAHQDKSRLVELTEGFTGSDASMHKVEFLETAALYYFVRDDTTYVTGNGKQTPIETLFVGGGQCLEQSRLLVDLLQSLNIESYQVTSDTLQHALVGVALKAIPSALGSSILHKQDVQLLLLDPTCRNCKFRQLPEAVDMQKADLAIKTNNTTD